jgi:hypothetical protein
MCFGGASKDANSIGAFLEQQDANPIITLLGSPPLLPPSVRWNPGVDLLEDKCVTSFDTLYLCGTARSAVLTPLLESSFRKIFLEGPFMKKV